MTQLFANNAYSSLAANASNVTTTLTLATDTGARFPSPTGGNYFLLTLVGLDSNANESSWEIVKVTARSTDTLTVVRAQESTTAVAWNTGTRVESRATAGTFSDWNGNTLPITAGGTGATTAAAARTALGLAIGTNVQAWDADLDAIAALAGTSGLLKKTAANTWTLDTTTYESTANKGAANGYVPLGSDSKIASTYLPSYVDDVLEYANLAAFPATGETGKIYVPLDTNKTYRWSGSAYVEISASPGSTDAVTEGSVNLYFTNARAIAALSGTLASYAPLASPTFTGSIKGDFSNATASSRVAFQTSTTNGSTIVGAKPNGTGAAAYLQAFNAADADNAGYVYLGITGSIASINSAKTGTGTALPIVFSVDSSEKMRISAAGNVGIGKSAPDQLVQVVGGNIDLQEQVAGRRIGFYVGDSYTTGTVGDAVATARYGLTYGSYVGSSVNLGGWGGVSISTGDAERLRITNAGAIGIGGANYGTAGQVLTSGGPSSAPTWSTVSGSGGFTQNSQSTNYTLILSDSGKQIFHPSTDTTARTFTIPANSSVAYPIGTELTVINQYGAGTVTLTSTDTLRLATTGTTGNALVATGNMAQLIKVTSTEWLVNGATKDVPTTIGQAYGGGFYAGKINVSGTQYYLIVAPKATGEASGKTWGTYGATTGITSVINGPANSASLDALGADYQAANFCENLTIGGFSDWYLPSKNELEVLYYFLKPTTTANNTASGSNANAVSPEPISTNYSSGSPAQTSAGIGFRTGETDAFASDYYWSSTEYSSNYAWAQYFNGGNQDYGDKYSGFYVRAVRRIAV